jgi:SAM-dependent methyltransferase
MDNYEFCAAFISKHMESGGRVLDYGCGAGQLVARLLQADEDAYGCDVYYEGGDYSGDVPKDLWEQGRIKKMENGRIPFPDGHFTALVNNQVLEHVSDFSLALEEFHRVLRPGGIVLSLFPDRRVIQEGHCGLPFLHWFPKGSSLRTYYAWTLRRLGLGYHKKAKDPLVWSKDFCRWLDEWTYYRSYSEIRNSFSRYFDSWQHHEETWLEWRKVPRHPWVTLVPRGWWGPVVRRWAGLVFTVRKPKM